MSAKKDSSNPLFEELLAELGLEEKSEFFLEYEDVISHMLSICSMKLMVKLCKLSQKKYYRKYATLSGLDLSGFDRWTLEEEIETGIVNMHIESDIFGPLNYCFEDPKREYFDLLIGRFIALITIKKDEKGRKEEEELLINPVTFGSLISEVSQAQEGNRDFWEEATMLVLHRKVIGNYRKVRRPGDVRIRMVPCIGSKYWGTREEASEFVAYQKVVAKSWAFTLAEWLVDYRPFIDMTKK